MRMSSRVHARFPRDFRVSSMGFLPTSRDFPVIGHTFISLRNSTFDNVQMFRTTAAVLDGLVSRRPALFGNLRTADFRVPISNFQKERVCLTLHIPEKGTTGPEL